MFRDDHHILHNRQEWELRPNAKRLRQTPSLIARLERPLHDEIHRECPPVPLLGHYALERTVRLFEAGSTTLESMDNLMLAIEQSSQHPKAHDIEKHLAELAVWAIDLQRPFIGRIRTIA